MRHFPESNVFWMDSIDSTNEEIKRKADKFIKTTWVLARSQTQGKGRNGKIWLSGKGNFAGSVIIFPTVKRAYYHLFSFFAKTTLVQNKSLLSGSINDKQLNSICIGKHKNMFIALRNIIGLVWFEI